MRAGNRAMTSDPSEPEARDGPDALAVSRIYDQLHALAEAQFRGQKGHHTLQPTALVHEAWMRLADRDTDSWKDKGHFLSSAARVMRHVLVDHARKVRASKRGGELQRVTLLTGDGAGGARAETDVLDLDQALERLGQEDDRLARVVELRFFAGLPIPEVAEALGVSHMTVSNDWRRARVWLARELAG
jgi:RNA polymerase sigma-70 factor (ECF subfamily)